MNDWKNCLVSPSTPVLETIKVIDAGQLQMAVVVDGEGKLLGTITDGDIRRSILRGINLNDASTSVMNKTPTTALYGEKKSKILKLMQDKTLRRIPVVDESGRIRDIETLEVLLSVPRDVNDHWVVLMAGGLGQRLAPLTDTCPKPLLKVGDRPVMETILINFIEHGFRKFFVAVNYKAEMIQEYFGDGSKWHAEITYVHEEERLGTAGALSLLPAKPTKPMIVMNGDLLTKVNFDSLLEFHEEHSAAGTMCVREYDFQVPYGVVTLEADDITGISEKPIQRFFVNAGIYVLNPSTFDLLEKGKVLDMPSLFEKLIERKERTVAFPIREYWLDIGRFDDLQRAQIEFEGNFR